MLVGYTEDRVTGFCLLRLDCAEILKDDSRKVCVLEGNSIQKRFILEMTIL